MKKFASDNYWKSRNFGLNEMKYHHDVYKTGLKVYQQGVQEQQFQQKLNAAKDAAGAALLFKIGQYIEKNGDKSPKWQGPVNVPQHGYNRAWKAMNPVTKPILL